MTSASLVVVVFQSPPTVHCITRRVNILMGLSLNVGQNSDAIAFNHARLHSKNSCLTVMQ